MDIEIVIEFLINIILYLKALILVSGTQKIHTSKNALDPSSKFSNIPKDAFIFKILIATSVRINHKRCHITC